jgi:cytidine deaminase
MDNSFSELVQAARRVRAHSYSPYSHFAVGAAVQVASGDIFTGTNIENISFGLTICAERAAVAAAIAAGERDLRVLAVVTDSVEPAVPCGACRQVLAEFCPSLHVLSVTLAGTYKEDSLEHLLPAPTRGILEGNV